MRKQEQESLRRLDKADFANDEAREAAKRETRLFYRRRWEVKLKQFAENSETITREKERRRQREQDYRHDMPGPRVR